MNHRLLWPRYWVLAFFLVFAAGMAERATALDAPVLRLSTAGYRVMLDWPAVAGAVGYTLYYAPFPDAESVGSVDLGDELRVSATLPQGAAFYVAVQAHDLQTGGPLSNIEHFTLPVTAVWQPRPGTSWQWQLSGEIDLSPDVQMFDLDLFDTPQAVIDQLHAAGRVVICYFSAGSWEEWRPDAAQFPAAVQGLDLAGWPGEKWLDVRRLDVLGPPMAARLDLAARKGCDGVEPDNVDGYANPSGFPLRGRDQLTYNRWLAEQAHQRGLSVGLKNDLGQIPDLVDLFDWALNEECFQYDECEELLPFVQAGKAVFGVEYEGDPAVFCPLANGMNLDWLQKRPELDAWWVACR